MNRILTGLLIIFTACAAHATTYYVAPSGNDNTFTGTVPSPTGNDGPWQSIAKVNASTFQSGDSILFQCGGIWREQLSLPSSGVVGNPITIGHYGTNCNATNKPVISGADIVPAASWTSEGGNIYSALLVGSPTPATLLNETFDSNISNWYFNYGSTMAWQGTCSPTGGGCMVIPGNSGTIHYGLSVKYGKSYAVRFSAKTADTNQIMGIGVRRDYGDYHFIEDAEGTNNRRHFTVGPAWKTYEYVFTSVSAESNVARVDIGSGGVDTIYIDDLSITESPGDVQQVFVDGAPLNIAHYPTKGSGYFTINSPVTGLSGFSTGADLDAAIAADNLTLGESDFVGAGVHIRNGNFWIDDTKVYSYTNKLITLNDPTTDSAPPVGWGYYLDNKVWMLGSSTTGGWAYDRNTQRLYVKMPDGSNPGAHIEASYRRFGIYGADRGNIVVDGLHINSVGTGVGFNDADNFTISNTDINHAAMFGLAAFDVGSGVINACSVDQSGSQGMLFSIKSAVAPASYSFTIDNNQVSNTDVRLVGGAIVSLPMNGGYGINIAGPVDYLSGPVDPVRNQPYALPRLAILNNTLTNSGQVGIGFARAEATVQNNVVTESCLILDDCGAIYAGGGVFPNGQITGNIMINSYGNANGRPIGSASAAQGLYLDDLTTGLTVSGNTVINADNTSQMHRSFGNTYINNTFYAARRNGLWFQEDNHDAHTYSAAGGQMINNKMNNNIVFPFTVTPPMQFESGLYRSGACDPQVPDTCFYDMLRSETNNTFTGNTYSQLYADYIASDYFKDPVVTSTQLSFADWQVKGTNEAMFRPFVIRPFRVISRDSANFISNGGFGSNVDGWSSYTDGDLPGHPPQASVTFQGSCGTSATGGCLKFTTSSAGVGYLTYNSTSGVEQGKTYLVEFKAATNLDLVPLNVALSMVGPVTPIASNQSIVGQTGWKRFGLVFRSTTTLNPANGEYLRLDISAPAGQVVYLDDISIKAVTADEHTDFSADSRILVNKTSGMQTFACPDTDTTRCGSYIDLNGNAVTWPVTLPLGYDSKIIVWNANPFADTDLDGVTDGEDSCPQSTQSVDAANASGCAPTDLSVSLGAAPQPVLLGNTITYTLPIKNNGPDQAGSVSATLTLPSTQVSQVTAASSQGLCTVTGSTVTCSAGAMNTGATVTVTVMAKVVSSGTLSAQATVSGAGLDSNTANNTASISTTVQAPDLTPTALTATRSSGTLTIKDSVKNQGTAAAGPFTISYYLSSNTTYDAADKLICSRSVSSLAVGASNPSTGTTTTTCATPAVPNGAYYVLAVVDSGNTVAESNETNNTKATTSTMILGADLIPQTITATKSGSTLTIKDSVKNQGTAPAGAFTISFYLSKDTVYQSGTDYLICSRAVGSLGVGALNPTSGTFTSTCTVPAAAPSGKYYVLVVDDATNAIVETVETNNTKATSGTITK